MSRHYVVNQDSVSSREGRTFCDRSGIQRAQRRSDRKEPVQHESVTFKFPELDGKLPHPVPANLGVPSWIKAMPTKSFSAINLRDDETIKRCPPFIDAMTCGFLIPLICDLKVENGEITWDNEIPPGGSTRFPPFANRIPPRGPGHRHAPVRIRPLHC
jgi:hypothetical protein